MQISAKGDYAVRAALELAAAFPLTASAQCLAQRQDLPHKFLESVLADLRRSAIIRAVRGPDGGYVLCRPPDSVMIGDILRAADGPLAGVRGLRPERTGYTGAAAHLPELWVAIRAAVRSVLDEVSLSHVLAGRMPAEVGALLDLPGAWQPHSTRSPF